MTSRSPAPDRSGKTIGAKALHPSIELLMRESSAPTPQEAVRAAARSMVARARSQGWSGPPFDLRILASTLGITERAVPGLRQDALIMPAAGGASFEILWNDAVPETRRNFTFGHEISHTFFPDCAQTIRYRQPIHRCDPQKPLEALCDLGASELLLPLEEFREDVKRLGVSLATLDALRVRYVASREAVASRMISLDLEPCAVAMLTCRLSPRELAASKQLALPSVDRPEPKYRVDMMFTSASFGVARLPLHKSVPDDSCVYRAAETATEFLGGVANSIERWSIGRGLLPTCRVHAMAVPPNGDGEPRVLVFLFHESAPHSRARG